jgi:hypothetical protein
VEGVLAARGDEKNPDLALAKAARQQSQARNMTVPGFPPYSLFASMHSSPPLLGAGVSLFFNWQLFGVVLSVALSIVIGLTTPTLDTYDDLYPDICLSYAPVVVENGTVPSPSENGPSKLGLIGRLFFFARVQCGSLRI